MRVRNLSTVAVVFAAAAALSACGTVSRLNPFDKDETPSARASEGERIPIVAFQQQVSASDALQGVEFFIPDAQPIGAWPLPGGTAEQTVDHAAAGARFEIAWRADVGAGSNRKTQLTAPPVAVDGRVYTMDGDASVVATDAATGRRVWRVDVAQRQKRDREGFGGGLAVADGKVFVSSGYRFVVALNSADGSELWRASTDAPVHSAPTVSGRRVFATDVDNQILAFDIESGDVAWTYQAIVEPARVLRASSPAVQGEALVAPFSSGELVALRAVNGNALWTEVLSRTSRTNALSEIRDIAGRPAIYRGDVYAASHSGVFAAIDMRSGTRKWDLPVASVNTPVPAGDVVYIVSQAGELLAVNRESGQVYWVRDLNAGRERKEGGFFGMVGGRTVRPIWTGPLLASGRLVLVNSEGEAVAVDAKTGEIQRTLKLGGAAYLAPIAYGEMIYVVTDEGRLVAIR